MKLKWMHDKQIDVAEIVMIAWVILISVSFLLACTEIKRLSEQVNRLQVKIYDVEQEYNDVLNCTLPLADKDNVAGR